MKPLLYLEIRQLINSIKNTARSPKRLIPTLIIGAWLFSCIMQSLFLLSGAQTPLQQGIGHMNPKISEVPWEMVKAGIFLFLSLGGLLVIYSAFNSGALIFSIAQIDFLFPTPINKKKVLLLKLLKDYLKYGGYVIFFIILFGTPVLGVLQINLFPYGLISMAALIGFLLLIINVAHTINIVFTFGFERLKQTGLLIKGILLLTVTSILAYGIIQFMQTGSSISSLLQAAESPIVSVVFAPAKWCSTLILAPVFLPFPEDYLHLLGLWLLAGGSFLLLMSRKENLYEPSIGISVKYAKRRSAMRSGDYAGMRAENMLERGKHRPSGLSIPAFGRGAVALVWKNLLMKYRVSHGQLAVMMILPAVVLFAVNRIDAPPEVLRNLPFLFIYVTYMLSMMMQGDIRAELKHANVLKSMPVAAWKVMMAQAISGAIYLGGGILAFALWLGYMVPDVRHDILITCALSSPFIGYATISAVMIPSLLYPDSRDMAQNYICGIVSMLLVSLAVIPTMVIGAVMLFLLQASPYITLLAVVLANVIVGSAGISIAGAIFRTFDPTSE